MKKKTSLALLLFFTSLFVFAQTNIEGQDYFMDAEGVFHQILRWEKTNAQYYDVEIEEMLSENEWIAAAVKRIEDNTVTLTLSPGRYRWRVHGYNVLGRLAATSEWIRVRVYPARTPVIRDFYPKAFTDTNSDFFTLTIWGTDLTEDGEIYLVEYGKRRARSIYPQSVEWNFEETEIRAVFKAKDFSSGAYDMVIVNPGGLRQRLTDDFESRQPWQFNFSAGMSALPVYGPLVDSLKGYNLNTIDWNPLNTTGLYARVGLIPFQWGAHDLGIEFGLYNGVFIRDEIYEYSYPGELRGNITFLHINVLYQYWFAQRTIDRKSVV